MFRTRVVPPPVLAPQNEVSKAPGWIKADRPFPDFRIFDLEGGNCTLAELKGAVTFVNVWAAWCEPCGADLPALQKLHDRLCEAGTARESSHVIRISVPAWWRRLSPKHRYSFPVGLGQRGFDALKPIGGIPLNCILDRKGVIRWENLGFSGGKDDERVKEMLAKSQEFGRLERVNYRLLFRSAYLGKVCGPPFLERQVG